MPANMLLHLTVGFAGSRRAANRWTDSRTAMNGPSALSWYGAKTVYAHERLAPQQGKLCYEERVVVLQANSFDDALRLAEHEAEQYAAGLDGCRYLQFVNVFEMFDEELAAGSEVFSIMRSIDATPKEFVDRFYDDGSFHTR